MKVYFRLHVCKYEGTYKCIRVCVHICVSIYLCVYVYLLSTYLEGYFMKPVITGSVSCLILLYRRFLNTIMNFLVYNV